MDGLSELKYICIHGLVAKDGLDEYIYTWIGC